MEALLTKLSFVVSMTLQFATLRLLVRRQLQRRFFWFLIYIVYAVVEELLRLAVSGNSHWYREIYWWTEAGDVILSLTAFRESFLNVFQSYTRFRWFSRIIWGCVGLALSYAVFKAWFFPPVHATGRGTVILALDVAVDYSISAVGILYCVLVLVFRIREHQWDTGIILGFTVNSSLSVFGVLILSAFKPRFTLLSAWTPAVAYIIAEVIWIVALVRSDRTALAPIREVDINDVTKLDSYIRILGRLLGRKP